MLEHRLVAVLFHPPGFAGPHVVDGFAQLLHDVEAVEDVDRPAGLLGQHLEIRLPQVAAHEPQARCRMSSPEQFQAAAQAVFGSLAADPQQALAAGVDLVDQRQVVMAASPLDLVDADGLRRPTNRDAPGPRPTACRTESRTCSQVVWNTLATSFQESRPAQPARNHW